MRNKECNPLLTLRLTLLAANPAKGLWAAFYRELPQNCSLHIQPQVDSFGEMFAFFLCKIEYNN